MEKEDEYLKRKSCSIKHSLFRSHNISTLKYNHIKLLIDGIMLLIRSI